MVSSPETHPGTAAASPGAARSCERVEASGESAPPMVFSSVQRSRCDESARPTCAGDEVPPPSVPSPLGVSHARRGLLLIDRAPVFQAADARRFHTLQSFVPPGSCPGSSPESALLDVCPLAPPYRCRSCLIASVASPRGCLFQKASFESPSVLQDERRSRALLVVVRLRGAPGLGLGCRHPSVPGLLPPLRACAHRCGWTFDVSPPSPWRCPP